MISPQNIIPPKNWQDFETLCLKLWGEIWHKRDDIDFNSDNSSGQDGVDIYCIPDGETAYYGIQCKNKNLFRKNGQLNQLTKTIIDEEIEKAKKFKPSLKKLIIATSIGKDKLIEEYVREKNIQHIQKNLFNIQLCFWDYISRKLCEFEDVYNWYLKNENYRNTKSVLVTFENDKQELTLEPKFVKNHVTYRFQTKEEKKEEYEHFRKAFDNISNENRENFVDRFLSLFKKQPLQYDGKTKLYINGVDIQSQEYIESTYLREKVDYSSASGRKISGISIGPYLPDKQEKSFKIKITNNGDSVLENLKLKFSFHGNYNEIDVNTPRLSEIKNYVPTTWINNNVGLIEPSVDFIVQKDSFVSKEIIFTPALSEKEIVTINWQLLSRDFNDSGQLLIHVQPKFRDRQKTMYVIKEEDCKEKVEYEYNYYRGTYKINI